MVVISNKEKLEMFFQLYLLNLEDFMRNSDPPSQVSKFLQEVLQDSQEQLEAFLFKNKVTVEDDMRSMLHEMLDKLNRLGYLPDAITRPDLYK